MSSRLSAKQLSVLADQVCELAHALTSHRAGGGPHWIMVGHMMAALAAHGVNVTLEDMDAAIALAVERCVLKTEGQPVHSISPWTKPPGPAALE